MWKFVRLSLILLFLFNFGCIRVVMNRKFAGDEGFTNAFGEWKIGVPKAVAFTSLSDRSYWQGQGFQIYIPIALDRKGKPWEYNPVIEEAVHNNEIRIDSVRTIFMTLGDTVVQPIYVWPSGIELRRGLTVGEVALSSPQGLFRGGDYICMFTDTLVIPAEEDSIQVNFTVQFKEPGSLNYIKRDFSHILWRQEGKKLYLDVDG